MSRAAALGLLAVLAAVAPSAPARADEPSVATEEIRLVAWPVLARAPRPVAGLIGPLVDAWDRQAPADRRKIERWLDLLAPLTAAQMTTLFAEALQKPADQQIAAIEEALKREADEGTLRPPTAPTRVVVVCVGGGDPLATSHLAAAVGGSEPFDPLAPRTVAEIRPGGAVLTNFKVSAGFVGLPFVGVLLTGRGNPAFDDVQAARGVGAPMVGELYRRTTGAGQESVWVLYHDVPFWAENSLSKEFREGNRKQTAIHTGRLKAIAGTKLADKVREFRTEDRSPFDLPFDLGNLTAGMLSVDLFTEHALSRQLLAWEVARSDGMDIESNAFIARAACDLLRSEVHPRLVIVRLGRAAEVPGLGRKEASARATRDQDALLGSIWDAARADALWRDRTWFWVLVEGGGVAFVAGPGVTPGSRPKETAQLTQVLPTVLHQLGLDPAAVLSDFGDVNKKPLDLK